MMSEFKIKIEFFRKAGFFFLCAFLILSCQSKKQTSDSEQKDLVPTAEKLAQKGRNIYLSQCIACHNSDPTKDGALGPAVFGSSLVLLEKKLLFKEYPEGYTPKRKTGQMTVFPHLKNEIPALHQFLNSK